MEVGSAFVRIRPRVSEEDVRALQALDVLSHDIAAAFDRFRAATSDAEEKMPPSLEEARNAA